jgi:hypothetical protein
MYFSHCFVVYNFKILDSNLFRQICKAFPACKWLFSVFRRFIHFWLRKNHRWLFIDIYQCCILWFSPWRGRSFNNFDIVSCIFIGLLCLCEELVGRFSLFLSLSLRLFFGFQIFLYFYFLLMNFFELIFNTFAHIYSVLL